METGNLNITKEENEPNSDQEVFLFNLIPTELPEKFEHAIDQTKCTEEEYTVRANLKNDEDILKWIREFSTSTMTQWNTKRLRRGVYKIQKEFVCHHSSFMKKPKNEFGCNRRGISKNDNCLARVRINVAVSPGKRARNNDLFLKNGLWATIRIARKHTHALRTAKTLRFLQDKSGTLREQFFEYFFQNMTTAAAKRFHELKLKSKNVSEAEFANGRINPTGDTIAHWFEQWRSSNLAEKPKTELEMNRRESLLIDTSTAAIEEVELDEADEINGSPIDIPNAATEELDEDEIDERNYEVQSSNSYHLVTNSSPQFVSAVSQDVSSPIQICRSYCTPATNESSSTKNESVVGIRIGLNYISWARIETKTNYLSHLNFFSLPDDMNKMGLNQIYSVANETIENLPTADYYTMESIPKIVSSTSGKLQLTTQATRMQLISMLVALINSSSNHSDESHQSVKFIKPRVTARLFNLSVGSETVASNEVVAKLLTKSDLIPFKPLDCCPDVLLCYNLAQKVDKEILGQAILVAVTFTELMCYKNLDCYNLLVGDLKKKPIV